jgi:hypothetical protein
MTRIAGGPGGMITHRLKLTRKLDEVEVGFRLGDQVDQPEKLIIPAFKFFFQHELNSRLRQVQVNCRHWQQCR